MTLHEGRPWLSEDSERKQRPLWHCLVSTSHFGDDYNWADHNIVLNSCRLWACFPRPTQILTFSLYSVSQPCCTSTLVGCCSLYPPRHPDADVGLGWRIDSTAPHYGLWAWPCKVQSYVSTEYLKPYHKPHYDNVKQVAPITVQNPGQDTMFPLVGLPHQPEAANLKIKRWRRDKGTLENYSHPSKHPSKHLKCLVSVHDSLQHSVAPFLFFVFLHLLFLWAHRNPTTVQA